MHFRKFLVKDGFDMMQYSIYTRFCPNKDILEKHMKRIKKNLPRDGSVRVLSVTNQQYADMFVLVGEKKSNEKKITAENLTLF